MNEIDKQKILNLYFNKMYSYNDIINHFNNKYKYSEIRQVIDNYFRKVGGFNEK